MSSPCSFLSMRRRPPLSLSIYLPIPPLPSPPARLLQQVPRLLARVRYQLPRHALRVPAGAVPVSSKGCVVGHAGRSVDRFANETRRKKEKKGRGGCSGCVSVDFACTEKSKDGRTCGGVWGKGEISHIPSLSHTDQSHPPLSLSHTHMHTLSTTHRYALASSGTAGPLVLKSTRDMRGGLSGKSKGRAKRQRAPLPAALGAAVGACVGLVLVGV